MYNWGKQEADRDALPILKFINWLQKTREGRRERGKKKKKEKKNKFSMELKICSKSQRIRNTAQGKMTWKLLRPVYHLMQPVTCQPTIYCVIFSKWVTCFAFAFQIAHRSLWSQCYQDEILEGVLFLGEVSLSIMMVISASLWARCVWKSS